MKPCHRRLPTTLMEVRRPGCALLLVALIALNTCMAGAADAAPAARDRIGSSVGAVPADLLWARRLVAEVTPQDNVYATDPTVVQWAGVAGAHRAVNRSVCSTFVDRVLEQAYGYSAAQVTAWLGVYAKTIYRAVARKRGFIPISTVEAIRPGDIMAIDYYDDDSAATGHVLIVDQAPRPMGATAPWIPGTRQYGVEVIDSATSGHGEADTRAEPGRHWHTGVGRGLFRLYVEADGRIAGYSWSATAGSRFYAPTVRHLLVGRPALHPDA